MKIAVLGGSFNPIHIGHLILADNVCEKFGYDKILFIPVFSPPHKEMADAASAAHRLEMVRRAVKNDPRFEAEDCEIRREGVSYTWDTICFLEEKYKGSLSGRIGLIFGEDLIPHFDKWYKAQELAAKTDIILACRKEDAADDDVHSNKPSGEFGMKANLSAVRENFPYPHRIIENPRMDISSTDIRKKISENGAWRYLVSEGVFEYIKNGKLYGFKEI